MKPSIERVFVFSFAIRTHGKRRHRCLWSVVRNIFDDGETWSAVGAVDEGITIAAVVGVEHLTQAVVTDGNVRRDGLECGGNGFRVDNIEGVESA